MPRYPPFQLQSDRYFHSTPGREWEEGDHVVSHPFGHHCTIKSYDGSTAVLLIDEPHEHWSDRVISQDYELQLVRDYEIEEADRANKYLTRDLKEIEANIRRLTRRSVEIHEQRSEVRKRLRKAKDLPIKSEAHV